MKNRGFTIVELLAVIVILGVLVAIAVPAVMQAQSGAKDKIYDTKVKMIEDAASMYVQDNFGTYKKNNQTSACISLDSLIGNYVEADKDGKVINPKTNTAFEDVKIKVTINFNTKSITSEFDKC